MKNPVLVRASHGNAKKTVVLDGNTDGVSSVEEDWKMHQERSRRSTVQRTSISNAPVCIQDADELN